MKKVLLVTPHLPPTAGGPSIHAKKLMTHFNFPIFNFEKYKRLPSGVRHVFAFFDIFVKVIGKDTILALDGFTVALPSIFVGKILCKKVILRVGGDFVYEQSLYKKEVDLETFYKNFSDYQKLFPKTLYLKYLVQSYVLKNADAIIFNTSWQKDICKDHYKLSSDLYVIENPVEPIDKNIYENANVREEFDLALEKNKNIFTSITRDIPYKNIKRLKKVFDELGEQYHLETQQGSWESCLKRISFSRAYICASLSDISPNQVQEALSLKIPVIISKYTGITQYLQNAGVARVIDPFDEQDIRNAILEMCDDNKYSFYKNNLENFSWPQTWETLYKQYQEIL
jgi:glycosyltransferase involved in cell wall biosynthesis